MTRTGRTVSICVALRMDIVAPPPICRVQAIVITTKELKPNMIKQRMCLKAELKRGLFKGGESYFQIVQR
jgi:hypothetical protein